jgi:hypothetical protein
MLIHQLSPKKNGTQTRMKKSRGLEENAVRPINVDRDDCDVTIMTTCSGG